jgi:hypothetical protein
MYSCVKRQLFFHTLTSSRHDGRTRELRALQLQGTRQHLIRRETLERNMM